MKTINLESDYNKFKMFPQNRPVKMDGKNVKSKVESIKKLGFVGAIDVIEIDGFLYIADGQHRFTACKIMDISVPYILIDDADIAQTGLSKEDYVKNIIHNLNTAQVNWTLRDYINQHAKNGDQFYVDLVDFINKTTDITYGNMIKIYCGYKVKSRDIINGLVPEPNPEAQIMLDFIINLQTKRNHNLNTKMFDALIDEFRIKENDTPNQKRIRNDKRDVILEYEYKFEWSPKDKNEAIKTLKSIWTRYNPSSKNKKVDTINVPNIIAETEPVA